MADSAETQYVRGEHRAGSVPLSTKIFQGFGSLVGSHKDFAFNTFLLLYYSQILGVSAGLAAAALGIALLFDAITDPIVGSYSDRFGSRLGRRHPFMYAAAVPLGVSMFALFSPPATADTTILLAWLFVFTLATRLSLTFFSVPWNALGAEFTNDYVERTSIIAFRFIVGWIGGAAFSFSMYTLVFVSSEEYPAGQLNPANYPLFAIVVASLITFWCLLTTHMTRKDIKYLRQPTENSRAVSLTRSWADIRIALSSRNYRLLFVATLMFAGLGGVGGVFDIYMNTYFWEFRTEDLRWFFLVIFGAMAAVALAPLLQKRFQKHHILVVMMSCVMINAMAKVLFRFLDVWPDNGDPMLLNLLILQGVLQMFLLNTAGIMFVSMIGDLTDEQHLRVGLRQEGVFASATSFSAKATSSIGLTVGGLLLDAVIRFPRGTGVGEVADDVLIRLAVVDAIVVPLFFFVPIWLMARYTLTRAQLEHIQDTLAEREQR